MMYPHNVRMTLIASRKSEPKTSQYLFHDVITFENLHMVQSIRTLQHFVSSLPTCVHNNNTHDNYMFTHLKDGMNKNVPLDHKCILVSHDLYCSY